MISRWVLSRQAANKESATLISCAANRFRSRSDDCSSVGNNHVQSIHTRESPMTRSMLGRRAIFILTWFSGGGAGVLPEDFNKTIKAEISDKQTRKSIGKITKQMEKDAASFEKTLEKLAKEALKLNADYDADRDEFIRMADQMIGNKEQIQKGLLDQRFALVELMTEEEWNAVWKPIDQ